MNPSLQQTLAQSMQPGSSPMSSVTPGAPTFDPSLVTPQQAPMPNRSPMSQIHISHPDLHAALQKRGIDPQSINYTPAQYATPNAGPDGTDNRQVTIPGKITDHAPGKEGTQIPIGEAEAIVKALSKRLEHKSKMEQNGYSPLPGGSSEPISHYMNSTPLTNQKMADLHMGGSAVGTI